MNENEQTVEETVIPTETTEETIEVEQTSADPIDAVEDIDELRRIAKGLRASTNRYRKDAKQTKPHITNTEPNSKGYNILEDEVADLIIAFFTWTIFFSLS